MCDRSGAARALERIPVVGDELSIARIKANPDQHFEAPFVLTGAAGISDYYNFGFGHAQDDFYSFQLDVAAPMDRLATLSTSTFAALTARPSPSGSHAPKNSNTTSRWLCT